MRCPDADVNKRGHEDELILQKGSSTLVAIQILLEIRICCLNIVNLFDLIISNLSSYIILCREHNRFFIELCHSEMFYIAF